MNERRIKQERNAKNEYSFINDEDEDEDDEDIPLLPPISTTTEPGQTIGRNITSARRPHSRGGVHPRYAKKIQNERMTGRTFLSNERSDWNRNYPLAHGLSSPQSSLLSCHGCCCVQCIKTNEVGIIEYFGEFHRVAEAGLSCIKWPCVRIAGVVSLRVQQIDVTFEGKTKDNVFVTMKIAILYQITIENARRAFYTLEDPQKQLKVHAYDIVRSVISLINIDDLFLSSVLELDASLEILRGLQRIFSQHYTGYHVLNVLIMEISPDDRVRDAMNEINACKRWKEAMAHKAEADKIKKIRMAEAESETLYLHGVGTAKGRDAIVNGMQATLLEVESEMLKKKYGDGVDVDVSYSKDIMDILLISQYYDTLSCISSGSPSSQKSMILHHGGRVTAELQEQIADLCNSGCG